MVVPAVARPTAPPTPLTRTLARTPDALAWAAAGVRRQQQRARFATRVAQARQWERMRRG